MYTYTGIRYIKFCKKHVLLLLPGYTLLCTVLVLKTEDSLTTLQLQLTLQQQSIFRQLQQWACIFKLYVLFVTV